MLQKILDWPLFAAKLTRDELFEKTGFYGLSRIPYPTKYMSPTGLALSCDAYGGKAYLLGGRLAQIDLSTYRNLPDGAVIWTRTDALPVFVREALPHLPSRFVLVTGNSDHCSPSAFAADADALAASGKVMRWFTVNYDGSAHREIVTPIPIGIEYPVRNDMNINSRLGSIRAEKFAPAKHEALWDEIARGAPPLALRPLLAHADFHFNNTSRSRLFGESREEIFAILRDNPNIAWMPKRVSRTDVLSWYGRYAFTLVPHGRALDGHRTWEALLMGGIVIVKKSPLDVLYGGLPIVSIDNWSDITAENMRRWFAEYGPGFDRGRVHEILSMNYWAGRIRTAAKYI